MDLLELQSLEQILNDTNHFDIETVGDDGLLMAGDLRHRLHSGPGMVWSFALLVGTTSEDAKTGMILLESPSPAGVYAGIYYRRADCGNEGEASRVTAQMLTYLDQWHNVEGLIRTVTHYDRLRVVNIGDEEIAVTRGGWGPSIEPLD